MLEWLADAKCRVPRFRVQRLLQRWSDVDTALNLKRVSRAVAELHTDRVRCKRSACLDLRHNNGPVRLDQVPDEGVQVQQSGKKLLCKPHGAKLGAGKLGIACAAGVRSLPVLRLMASCACLVMQGIAGVASRTGSGLPGGGTLSAG